jgi:hypothetical protein
MTLPESPYSEAGSGARSDRPSVPTGGSRADLYPVAIFISRPGAETEIRHLPAGSSIATHNASGQGPIEYSHDSQTKSNLPYINSPCDRSRYQPVSHGSCVLRSPTVLKISPTSKVSQDDGESTWLPAGTLIQEVSTKCPDCPTPNIESDSPSESGNKLRESQKVSVRRLKANMFPWSKVYTKSGDKLLSPTGGGVKETGTKTGEGYFDITEEDGNVSITAWKSIDGDEPSQIQDGVITTIPYGDHRSWLVSLNDPQRDCDGLRFTDYHCKRSLFSNHAIPNAELKDFLDQRKSELKDIRRSKAQPPA